MKGGSLLPGPLRSISVGGRVEPLAVRRHAADFTARQMDHRGNLPESSFWRWTADRSARGSLSSATIGSISVIVRPAPRLSEHPKAERRPALGRMPPRLDHSEIGSVRCVPKRFRPKAETASIRGSMPAMVHRGHTRIMPIRHLCPGSCRAPSRSCSPWLCKRSAAGVVYGGSLEITTRGRGENRELHRCRHRWHLHRLRTGR